MKSIAVLFVLFFGAITINAQSIEGLWNTGNENTIVKISKVNSSYQGKIHSSENPKAKKGIVLVKDIVKSGNIYNGKIYVAKRNKWLAAKFEPKNEKLYVTVSAPFGSKKVTWTKHN